MFGIFAILQVDRTHRTAGFDLVACISSRLCSLVPKVPLPSSAVGHPTL